MSPPPLKIAWFVLFTLNVLGDLSMNTINSSLKISQYQQKTDIFPCGSLSPCDCTKSAQDPDLTIVSQCPVKNRFLMITGIEAKRVKIVPAIMSKFDGFKMNISIINTTIKSIEDLHTNEVNGQIERALGHIKTLILRNNKQLVLPDFDQLKVAGVENLVFCKNAVNQIIGRAIHAVELTFFHLGNFSMNFSLEENDEHFSEMRANYIYIEGIMSDIFLPKFTVLDRVVIKKVQSITNSELLQKDALTETIIRKEIRIEESIHITLPKNFMNGEANQIHAPPYPFDFILDPWNVQQNVFVETTVSFKKTFNGVALNDSQRKALVSDNTGKSCDLFCQCGQKSKVNCSSCGDKHKKNCAICIKNKLKLGNQDMYKKICSIEDMSIVNGPAQIYSSSTASNLLKSTKRNDKEWQTIQSTCSESYISKSTELSMGQKKYFYSTILIATFAAKLSILFIGECCDWKNLIAIDLKRVLVWKSHQLHFSELCLPKTWNQILQKLQRRQSFWGKWPFHIFSRKMRQWNVLYKKNI